MSDAATDSRYPYYMGERIAKLEQIAENTAVLTDMRADIRDLRRETRTQFYWLLGLILLSGAGQTVATALGLLH